jgi:hypothetical protein
MTTLTCSHNYNPFYSENILDKIVLSDTLTSIDVNYFSSDLPNGNSFTISSHFSASQIEISSKGNIFLLDHNRRAVLMVDAYGNLKEKVGEIGKGPGEFVKPINMSIDKHDNLYVLDISQSKISVFDSLNTFKHEFLLDEGDLNLAKIFAYDSTFIAFNNPNPKEALIKIFNHRGDFIFEFGDVKEFSHPIYLKRKEEYDKINTKLMNSIELQYLADQIHILYMNRPLYQVYDFNGILLEEKEIFSTDIDNAVNEILLKQEKSFIKSRNPRARSVYWLFSDFYKINNDCLGIGLFWGSKLENNTNYIINSKLEPTKIIKFKPKSTNILFSKKQKINDSLFIGTDMFHDYMLEANYNEEYLCF